MATTAVPPVLPPAVDEQMQSPNAPLFMQAGQAISGEASGTPSPTDAIRQLETLLNQYREVLEKMYKTVNLVDPSLGALLVGAAQTGKALEQEIKDLRSKQAGPRGETPSTKVTPTPGEAPPARPGS